MITRTIKDYAQSLANYLPGGRIFKQKNIEGSNLRKLLNGLSGELFTADGYLKEYTKEIIPNTTTQFLEEWEKTLGIPGGCFIVEDTIEKRQQNIALKLASLGVQTAEEFEILATLVGETAEIDQPGPYEIRARGPGLTGGVPPYDVPFIPSVTLTTLECFFNTLKPANCSMTFENALFWDISTAVYDSVSFSVATQDAVPAGVFFKSDGSKMYVIGVVSGAVYQYSLPTPWVLTGATYDSVSFSIVAQDAAPTAIFFKSDGSKMYMIGNNTDAVYQYTLSTPWSLTGATYDSISFSVAAQDTSANAIFFKSDGTKMYMLGNASDTVYQYSLPTPWVLAGASYDSVSFSVTTQETNPTAIFFKSDGSKMYVVGNINDTVYQYSLPTPWVLTGATYDSVSFSIAGQETNPTTMFFKPVGSKMYIAGTINDTVYQYSIG